MDQAAFAVPKDKQDVTVQLGDGAAIEGTIFLEYAPGDPSVHHRMTTFLEGETTFFPISLKGGETQFISKRNIKQIDLGYRDDQEDLKTALSLMKMINITAVFLDKTTIHGELMADVPIEKTRLSDILNLPAKFLYVKVDNKRICYVNKDAVRKVSHAQKR